MNIKLCYRKYAIYFIFLLILCFFAYFIVSMRKRRETMSSMLNIYDEPLQSCKVGSMSSGSWDDSGKCSELGGGVHQICINDIANNTEKFSYKTGQSDWSEERGSDNHCVCLGAWSLYNAESGTNKSNTNILKCDAIPKVALTNNYVSKFSEGWNKWNGLELNNQIKHGVESLVKNCYNKGDGKSEKLRKNYCKFAKKVKTLKDTDMYRELC
jgi:hypothetical protein